MTRASPLRIGRLTPARTGLRLWRAAGLAALVGASLIAAPAGPMLAQTRGPASVADIAAKLQSAVVNISTTQKLKDSREIPVPEVPKGSPFEEFFEDFFDKEDRGGGQRANSLGSGFIIDPKGLVVTNNHVIEGADEITVILTDGTKLKVAEVVGRDTKTDLALLRVEPTSPLPAVSFGDSTKMRVGDWVMAIGNPFGLGGTLTVGVISATRRDIQSGLYDEFLQTDAAINRGNSGGPLFNMEGEVVGINTAIISPTGGSIGIGFAVPSSTASQVIGQLKQYGETRRGWLGVRIQSVNEEIAESVGLTGSGGALVASVTPDGPAAAAGVQVGDIILSFDGQDVTAMRQLPKLVSLTPIDKQADLVVLRKGERITLKVKVGRLEEEAKPASAKPEKNESPVPQKKSSLGLTFSNITDELRSRFGIDRNVTGVVITEVDPESPVAEKEVKVGDVVVEVTHEKVQSPAEINARLDALRKLKRKSALLTVSDGQGELSFVAVAIGDR
ncbi:MULTISPECIES: Do family serine endopeptidase [Rhodomicrobium]|uniref:Do family serine endopeptidase n=1 Tax=Rhodomicrobium TaxID=1068 RepID=UPI000B4ACA6A|nr:MULTISPECIES: Do family serine endopeptidase [Rhodomicrobium]